MKISLNKNWRFMEGNMAPKTEAEGWGGAKAHAYNFGAVAAKCKDAGWRRVDLPHDFVVEGDYTRKKGGDSDMQQIPEMESIDSRLCAGGSLPGGIAWYRHTFEINETEGKRIYLYFGGVYRDCTVYLNEYYVGKHTTGYTSFYFDITDFVNMNGKNILAVRVDATGREGWWYEGGGIYRDVWLEVTDSVHIAPWGCFAHSEVELAGRNAEITVETEIRNMNLSDKLVTVETMVYDNDGNIAAQAKQDINVVFADSAVCRQSVRIANAHLWDIDDPYLYKFAVNIYADGVLCDTYAANHGIRNMRFDCDKGFFLNGRKVKIKGLCCHHDHAGVGIGVPDDIWEYRLSLMKEMGMNGYRCAHHQPAEALLDACDRLGILMFEETRRMSSCNDDMEALRAMVKRDRNHPSIFLWGIGNEEIFSQDSPETARTTITMKTAVKKLDPTRPITSAVVCWNGIERFDTAENYVGVTKNLDIMGFNYCVKAWDDYHKRMPEQPVIITEASATAWTRGCCSTDESHGHYYSFDTANMEKVENKRKAIKRDMGETEWKAFDEREYLAGIFLWTGFDYRGEPTPLGYPGVYSQFGIFDYCGFRKDSYYYYKSWWTDEPTAHIFPHWNYPVKEGEPVNVYCYTNTNEAEIFVNGKSYGRKKTEKNWYLEWENVIYEPGGIVVKGYNNGEEAVSESVRTTGAPKSIKLEVYKDSIKTDGTAIVNVSVCDENGEVVPTADNEIFFSIKGAGSFLGTGNGDPGDHSKDNVPFRRAFNGRCQLLAKADKNGIITITATSAGLDGAVCEVEVK